MTVSDVRVNGTASGSAPLCHSGCQWQPECKTEEARAAGLGASAAGARRFQAPFSVGKRAQASAAPAIWQLAGNLNHDRITDMPRRHRDRGPAGARNQGQWKLERGIAPRSGWVSTLSQPRLAT